MFVYSKCTLKKMPKSSFVNLIWKIAINYCVYDYSIINIRLVRGGGGGGVHTPLPLDSKKNMFLFVCFVCSFVCFLLVRVVGGVRKYPYPAYVKLGGNFRKENKTVSETPPPPPPPANFSGLARHHGLHAIVKHSSWRNPAYSPQININPFHDRVQEKEGFE